MTFAEKIDYSPIPVIEVARILLGSENRERTTHDEIHFHGHSGLFVNPKKNKWRSHGEGVGGDAIALIRFATGCDFKGALDWLRANGFEKYLGERPAPKRVVATYDYVTADGTVAYRVDRYEPKFFSQWREIDGERVNGVKAGLYQRTEFGGPWRTVKDQPRPLAEVRNFPAVTPVPYHLPKLIACANDPVLIPAGEKDVDNLLSLDLLATTNHGGEGKWWPELTPYFKGRRVFLLLDNDVAGEKHCAEVGAALKDVVKELRVVRFPELPEKGDVSDFIKLRLGEGLDTEAIKELLYQRFREAPAWAPSASPNVTIVTEIEWPEPDLSILSHQSLAPPKLPFAVFGSYWAKWIQVQAEAKSCAPDYVAGGLLGGAGVLIGNARWGAPWAGWEEPPIVWVCTVGLPSSGKSPGLDAIRDLIGSIEADSNTNHKDNLAAWDTQKREAKIRLDVWESACKAALKDKIGAMPPKPENTEEPPRPTRKRIVTNDPTVEKVARLVLENPKGMMLFRDELAGWIGALDKYGGAGGDRAFYLESYGGRAYAVDRMKDPEPIVVPSLTLSVMGGIQPDRLATLVLSGDDDGLAARFLYLWPERTPPKRPDTPVPSGAKAKLIKLFELEERRDEAGNRIALRFDEKAASALQEYRKQVAAAETDASGLYLSWLGKLPGVAVRLSTIFEHLHWCGDHEEKPAPESISETATVAAIAFLDQYAAPMARRCFGEAALPQVDIDARVLARWIIANPSEPAINSRDLRRMRILSAKADMTRYEAAIAELETAGWLRRPADHATEWGAGRKRKDWHISPKLPGRAE